MRDFAPSPANNPAGQGICFPSRAGLRLSSGLLFLFLFFSSVVSAQDIQPLDKRIDFRIDSMPLHDALRKIRDLSDVHITYNVDEIKNQPKQTLNIVNETVRKIFEKLLEHTNLQFVEGSGKEILIVPRRRKKDPVKGEVFTNVKGQVVDRKGYPLPNASIQLSSDKSTGYTTDGKGFFEITAPQNDHIKVSYLGMKGVDEPIKIGVFVKIVLDTAPAVMNEYVVTGYQSIDKRLLTGSVFTLTPDKFLEPGVTSVDQMLQGKVPGLVVVNNSGSPSATPTLRIRGTSTFLGNAAPLWVVDGVIKEDPVNLTPLDINAALSNAQNANFSIVGNAISGLNPYDIESMTFLKDAAATSIYGIRAANGVIVITTKKGKSGPTSVNYNTSLGFTGRLNYNTVDAMNSKDRINVSRELLDNGIYYSSMPLSVSYEGLLQQYYARSITQDQFAAKVAQLETMNTDWLNLLTSNAFNQSHSLGFSGGAGKTTYYTSFSFSDGNGTFKGDNTKRYTADINLSTALSSRLSLNVILSGYYRTAKNFYNVNPLDYALKTSRAIPADSFYVTKISTVDQTGNAGVPLHYNIFNELAQTGNTTNTQDVNAIATLNYRILPGLSYTGIYNADISSNRSFAYATDHSYTIAAIRGYDFGAAANGSALQKVSALPYGGLAYPGSSGNVVYGIRNTLNYNHNFFAGRDQFTLMAAQELSSVKTDGFNSQELGYYPDRGNTYFSSYYNAGSGNTSPTAQSIQHYAVTTNTILNKLSWMGTTSYTMNKKYTLFATLRADGSNRFGQYTNQRFLPNWSISGRWNIGDESWLEKSRILSGLDLRVSYGTAGNVVTTVGPNLIASYPTSPIDIGSNEFVLNLKSLPYPDLRWEKTRSINVGLDFNLFNHRIDLTVDGYYNQSKDLLVSHNIPEEYGIPSMYENFGTLDNKGGDANLRIVPIRTRDFEWAQSFNYSMNFNSVAQSGITNLYPDYISGSAIIPGKPIGSFWSYSFAGLDPVHGYPTFNHTGHYVGPNVDPATFLSYSGRSTPLIQLGTHTSIRYKALSLDAGFNISLGYVKRLNPIYLTQTQNGAPPPELNLPKELNNRWRQPGDEKKTNIPDFTNWNNYISNSGYTLPANQYGTSPYAMYNNSSVRVVNGNYLRCNNIRINYSIPGKIMHSMGIQGATMSASVNNPFIIDSKEFHGQDPETQNTGGTSLPITRSYNLTMNVSF